MVFLLNFLSRGTVYTQPEPNGQQLWTMDSNVETLPNPTLTLVEVSVSYCPLVT